MASHSPECYKRILDCTMSSHTTKQVQLVDQAISEASVQCNKRVIFDIDKIYILAGI